MGIITTNTIFEYLDLHNEAPTDVQDIINIHGSIFREKKINLLNVSCFRKELDENRSKFAYLAKEEKDPLILNSKKQEIKFIDVSTYQKFYNKILKDAIEAKQ